MDRFAKLSLPGITKKILKKRELRFNSNFIKGLADITLFGNMEDMVDHHHVGTKYLWVSAGGVLEMHGREKLPWTHLNEHIFRIK